MIFNLLHTAHEWGMSPGQFFELESEDKALMVVWSSIVGKMKASASMGKGKKGG